MRSDLIYSANKILANRFLLCRMTSVAARRMHRDRWHFSESINQALTHIARSPEDSLSGTELLSAAPPEVSLDFDANCDTLEVR